MEKPLMFQTKTGQIFALSSIECVNPAHVHDETGYWPSTVTLKSGKKLDLDSEDTERLEGFLILHATVSLTQEVENVENG